MPDIGPEINVLLNPASLIPDIAYGLGAGVVCTSWSCVDDKSPLLGFHTTLSATVEFAKVLMHILHPRMIIMDASS